MNIRRVFGGLSNPGPSCDGNPAGSDAGNAFRACNRRAGWLGWSHHDLPLADRGVADWRRYRRAPPQAQKLFEAGKYDELIQLVAATASPSSLERYLAGLANLKLEPPNREAARQAFDQLAGDERDAWTFVGRSADALVDDESDAAVEAAAKRSRWIRTRSSRTTSSDWRTRRRRTGPAPSRRSRKPRRSIRRSPTRTTTLARRTIT